MRKSSTASDSANGFRRMRPMATLRATSSPSCISATRRSIFRAFGKQPPDRGEIGKAIYKIGMCLGDDDLDLTGGPDAVAVPTLVTLSGILEGSLTAPAPARAALPPPPAALAHLERQAAPPAAESARFVADPADALPREETDTA